MPKGIVLTHVHPDHEGDARSLAERWDCPVWVSPAELPIARRDFDAMRVTAMPLDRWVILPVMRLMGSRRRERIFAAGTLATVARELDPEGEVPGMPDWVSVPTPGHTAGHVSLFRPAGRVLLSGDALVTARIDTARPWCSAGRGCRARRYTTWDRDASRRSMVRLADLAPDVVAASTGGR